MPSEKTGPFVALLVLVALFSLFVSALPLPFGETTQVKPDAQEPPPGSCIVAPAANITEFQRLAGNHGIGFRYSGAPLALTLSIHIQKFSRDDWDTRRKEITGNPPGEKDQVLAFRSCPVDQIERFESGQMGHDEQEYNLLSNQQGEILFQLPVNWWVSRSQTSVLQHVKSIGNQTKGVSHAEQLCLADELPAAIAIGWKRSEGMPASDLSERQTPVTIAPGETAELVSLIETRSSGGAGAEPVYRLVCSLRARCLRPPAGTVPEAK